MFTKKFKNQRGFTLVELLVVMAVIGFMTGLFIRNFNINRLYLQETMNIVLADIRNMQQQSLGSANYPVGSSTIRCGYGLERVSNTTYRFYVGPESQIPNDFCADSGNKNYNTKTGPMWLRDESIATKSLPYENIEFKTDFSDIFFVPPNPTIYVNNDSSFGAQPSVMTIGPIGQSCAGSNCRTICVYTSGAINTNTGTTCP